MQETIKKPLLYTLMLSVFLDVANFFMPIPIYTPLFLKTAFLQDMPSSTKAIMLGSLIACYGLMQFFSGPIFGNLSDKYDRKKILSLSLLLSTFSCLLSGIGLGLGSIPLIYISRLLLGFSSGTIAIVFAITASKSNKKNRAKNLGYITAGTSLGAVFGPFIGGYLVSSAKFSWFGYATPFYIMIVPYLINLLLLQKFLIVSPSQPTHKKIYLLAGFETIYKVMQNSASLFYLVFMVLLFQLASESFYLAAPIIAVKKLHLSPAIIGNHFFAQGITAIVVSLFFNKKLSNYFSSSKIFLINIFLLLSCFLLLAIVKSSFILYLPFLGLGSFGTLCWIHSNNLFSQAVTENEQGLIFGVSQALWAFASIFGSIIVGFSAAVHYTFSVIVPIFSGLLSCILAIILVFIIEKKQPIETPIILL